MRTLFALVIVVLVCAPAFGAAAVDKSYQQDIDKWRMERLDRLRSEDGWLTLIGLKWLKPGENKVGSAPAGDIVLPGKVPAQVGVLVLAKKTVTFRPAKGVDVTVDGKPAPPETRLRMDTDPNGKATVMALGTIRFHIIERGDKIGVRMRDTQSEARKQLTSLDYFPLDSKWRFRAKFVRYKPPKKVQFMNIIGQLETEESAGALVFNVSGKGYRLDAFQDPETGDLSLMFGDKTNGMESYGAGRFLDTPPPDSSDVVDLDFNRAYSPPCAFTPFATCPLPPKQNKLPIRVEAGEKAPAGMLHH